MPMPSSSMGGLSVVTTSEGLARFPTHPRPARQRLACGKAGAPAEESYVRFMSRGRRTLASTLAAPRALGGTPPAPEPELVLDARAPAPARAPALSAYPSGEAPPSVILSAALLDANDEPDARRAYLEYWRALGEDRTAELEAAGPDAFRIARRIARAHAQLRMFGPERLLTHAPSLTQRDLDLLGASRRTGDEMELNYSKDARGGLVGSLYRVPASQEALGALLRAIARNPYAYKGDGPFPAADGPRQINVSVPRQVLLDELEKSRSDGTFAGLRLMHWRRRQENTTTLSLGLVREAVVDGRPTRVVVTSKLGSSRATDAEGRRRSAASICRRHFPDCRELIRELEVDEEQFEAGIHALSAPLEAAELPAMSHDAFFGADRCGHPRASWRLNGIHERGRGAADAVVLHCEDCHRPQIEVIPLHRLPPGNHFARRLDDPKLAESYLERERFHAELAGDTRPVTSVAELRARDGVVLMAVPAPHASDSVSPADRRESLGEVLSGRRAQES